jgi:hypothetical protein
VAELFSKAEVNVEPCKKEEFGGGETFNKKEK